MVVISGDFVLYVFETEIPYNFIWTRMSKFIKTKLKKSANQYLWEGAI